MDERLKDDTTMVQRDDNGCPPHESTTDYAPCPYLQWRIPPCILVCAHPGNGGDRPVPVSELAVCPIRRQTRTKIQKPDHGAVSLRFIKKR
jgi:hypothetical protein